jgi:hypothetical protein
MKFHAGHVLTHTKGGTYVVILTPDICVLEETRESAYAYIPIETTKKIHVRRQTEMEDGWFTLLAE